MLEMLQPYSLKSLLAHPEFVEGQFWNRKSYDADQLVIVEGEKGNDIYVILEGKVSVCTNVKISEDRQMLSGLCELLEGHEFAHFCFFDDEPYSATVKTITPCQMAIIKAPKLKQFLERNPEIGFHLLFHWMQMLLPYLRQSNKRVANLFSWGLKAHQIDSLL
ncbi:Crp/Fnr family transcriptional regulator [Methylomicrobium sp. RS1]|jgi:CRP/FNR family cyclic AMP-dependent transcriptional regulator|uniref:Crp/Fnr family transcriptional regulator n=1 Tax=Candidatus Methylomicrobium oryzae TaxID=2802053 RepID=UPI0019234F11|nr:cyclic nucleotide-binding domain-containing protein [Methylomicrobium sp. RS1]MBL1263195.1 cyclic nucleotide-binding domain-containing protein [Methylomicrobium sp. RS1]